MGEPPPDGTRDDHNDRALASPASTVLATHAARALHNNFRTSVLMLQRSLVRSIHYLTVIHARRVHRALGYASIADYAADVAGFTRNQTEAFLALGRRLDAYPEVRRALDRGDLSWSKARLIVERAKPEDEQRWVAAAGSLAVRQLAAELDRLGAGESEIGGGAVAGGSELAAVGMDLAADDDRERGVAARSSEFGQAPAVGETAEATEAPVVPAHAGAQAASRAEAPRAPLAPAPADEKCHVTYALSPEEYLLWSAAHEALRRQGRSESRARLLVAGLASLAGAAAGGAAAPRYLLQIHHCPACEAAEIRNHRGRFAAPPALLASARCDAVIEDEDSRRRAVITPRLRRQVLRRDGYACQAPGCGSPAFIEIHHRAPVAAGGRSGIENLITLCGGCHRAIHEREMSLKEAARGPAW